MDFLRDKWTKNWNDSIVIVKKEHSPDDYLKMVKKYITDYYSRYKPFNQEGIIALDERIFINLNGFGGYKLIGCIDRLAKVEDGCCEIHDYKTCSRLPLLEHIKNDRQLALCSIGVKQRYLDVKDVRLIWHFLKFNKEINSTRTNEELDELKKNTIHLIDTIESAKEYQANPSKLCDWCKFNPICREWPHLYKIKKEEKSWME